MKQDRMCGSRCLGPMTFHREMKGTHVSISQGGQLASRDTSSFMNGLAFLSRPVKVDEKMCIRIESCSSRWDGALRLGFTNIRPDKHSIPPSSIPELRDTPGFCVLPVPADMCGHGADIHFWINYAGFVLIQGLTKEKHYIKAKGFNLNQSLWAFIDLYGNTSTVRLLGSRRGSRTSCPDVGNNRLVGERQVSEERPETNVRECSAETRGVRKTSWSLNLFLLQNAGQKTVPSPTERFQLTQDGLGIPDYESERTVVLNWTRRELKNFIRSSYPSVDLHAIGFSFNKADKYGRLCPLNVNTTNKLIKELGESVLYIIPDRDIVLKKMSTHISSVINRNASSPSGSAPSVPVQHRHRLVSSNSYMSDSSPNSSMDDIDVGSLLREFQQIHLSRREQVPILVNRNSLLQSAKETVSNCHFSWIKIPFVTFVGEKALDCGGPRREFFRLLMIEVQSSLGVFEGKPGNLLFTYDQMAFEHHKYELAGKLIAWSVAHGGPGIKALNPCLYQLMCIQECPLTDFSWHLIPDPDIQNKLQKILSCKTKADIHRLQKEEGDWICECGVPGIYSPDVSIEDIPQMYSYAVRHYIYFRTSKMIHQFINGLNAFGQFWDMVQSYWVEFLPIFTNTHEPISRRSFSALFQIHFSKAMSQEREAEEETIHYWELILKMIEDRESEFRFEELLVFITGADEVPPLGFPQKPSIHFYKPEKRGCRLPYANTCQMRLFLPRYVTNEVELHRMLLRAMRDSADFGRA